MHDVLESNSLWDAVLSGFVLFLVYARLRWADGQHVVRWEVDQDDECVPFLEASVGQHKTMRAAQHRFRFLPIAALGQGVRNHDWVSAWLDARRALGIKPPPKHLPLPAPDKAGNPRRGPRARDGFVHSAKATLLSWAAKAGRTYEDRLVMGYHSIPGRMALVCLLRLLQDLLLKQAREGTFVPDVSRSGRFPFKPSVVEVKDEEAEPADFPDRVPAPASFNVGLRGQGAEAAEDSGQLQLSGNHEDVLEQ